MSQPGLKTAVAGWSRWLHIYLSMVSFAIVFFFAITGITLNHAEWFTTGAMRTASYKGSLAVSWLKEPAKLEMVEALRARHGVRGEMSEFRVEDDQLAISFKGPGYTADALVDRKTGGYELTISALGLIAVLNDLHKGRDSGRAWSWVIDISAGLLTLASLSGMVLLWFVYKRRSSGYLVAAAGTMLSWMAYRLWVP